MASAKQDIEKSILRRKACHSTTSFPDISTWVVTYVLCTQVHLSHLSQGPPDISESFKIRSIIELFIRFEDEWFFDFYIYEFVIY